MSVEHLSNGNADGTTLGQSTSDLISLYGVTPVAQRSGSDQAAVATLSGSVATTSASNSSPYGYTTASQADAIVSTVNSLITKVNSTITLENELRAALVALGAIKGSA